MEQRFGGLPREETDVPCKPSISWGTKHQKPRFQIGHLGVTWLGRGVHAIEGLVLRSGVCKGRHHRRPSLLSWEAP